MTEQNNTNYSEEAFLSVEEAANIMKIKKETVYTMLCNTGVNGGEARNRFPDHLYIRLGRRVLFIKEKLIEWMLLGAKFVENDKKKQKKEDTNVKRDKSSTSNVKKNESIQEESNKNGVEKAEKIRKRIR